MNRNEGSQRDPTSAASGPRVCHDSLSASALVSVDRNAAERPSHIAIRVLSQGEAREVTYRDLQRDVRAATHRLRDAGIERGMRVGMLARNSYSWIVYDLALIELRCVSIVFPDDTALANPGELLEQHGLDLLLVGEPDASVEGHTRVMDLAGRLTARVDEESHARTRSDTDDELSWVFSSGTAGSAKGLVISRRGVEEEIARLRRTDLLKSEDRVLVFLPFSSFQQRFVYLAALVLSAEVQLAPMVLIAKALHDMKPSVLLAPPAFFDAMLGAIAKREDGDLAAVFGGATRVLLTGMAKVRESTIESYRAHGLTLLEAYGMTECGVIAANRPGAWKPGTVGRVMPGVEVRIEPDGEILVKKDHPQMKRYFSGKGQALDTRIEGHWIRTGDLGRFDDDDFLILVGRKKATLVLRDGHKIQPEPLEAALEEHASILRAVVLPSDDELSLIIVVDPVESVRDIAVSEWILSRADGRIPSWVRVEAVVFMDEPISAENGTLTRNLKLDRGAIARRIRERAEAPSQRGERRDTLCGNHGR